MTRRFPWFRCYDEILDDRKIERACVVTGQSKATVVGVWTSLMMLGNRSPVRGVLLFVENIPLTMTEIAAELGLDEVATAAILRQFELYQMLYWENGTCYLTNFSKRQYESDSSTGRVQRFRKRQKGHDQRDGNASDTEQRNVSETLQQRDGNGPDQIRSETDQTRTDQESGAAAPAPAGAPPALPTFNAWLEQLQPKTANRPAILREMFTVMFPGRDPPDFGYVGKIARKVGGAGRLAELMWLASPKPPSGDILAYCLTVHQNGSKPKGKERRDGTGGSSRQSNEATEETKRAVEAYLAGQRTGSPPGE